MNDAQRAGGFFDKKEAELLARHFNMCFHHALMYGVEHQLMRDSLGPLYATLTRLLAKVPLITVTIEYESIYIEGNCVDKTINARKLVAHFKKAGIQSFSFEVSVLAEQLAAFIGILSDLAKYPTAEAMKKELLWRNIPTIRINYVVFKKMTADEAVVSRDEAGAMSGAPRGVDTGAPVSLAELVRDPHGAMSALLSTTDGATASSIARLGSEVRHAAPSGELLEAILLVREECLARVGDAQAARLSGNGGIIDEVENLTRDAVLGIIREEYRAGAVSAKRLSQLLRRMLPDAGELRRLLPELKRTLLDAGMPFVKYVEFVTELRRELDGDTVIAQLSAATSEMGVTPDEVMDEIRKHPAEAARLIILASELRRTSGGSEAVFEQMFTEYIEQASRHSAIASAEASNPDNGKLLGTMLQKMEHNLLENLKRQGVEQSVLTALSARLAERLPYLLDTTKTDWLKKVLAERPDFDPAMLAKVLASTVSHAYDIDTHHDTFSALFQEKGLSPEQVKEILRHAARLVAATAATGELPKGVMSSNTFMYFLNRECKLSLRYHTPFSLLIASILRIETSDSTFEIPATDQHPRLILKVVSTLKQKLREIDMIGVSSTAAESIIFAILPMTEETKTYGLAERLRHEFAALTLETNGRMAHLNLALSISGFDAAAMDGRTVFLKAAMAHHRAAEKILLAGIPQ